MIFAVNGILLEVLKRVMHPSHIPLQAEAEAAEINRPRNHGPGGRFLRCGLDVRMLFVSFLIEAAEKFDGLQILASAEFIRNPFTLLARIIEVEHGSDCIHAQAVDVILVEPEHRARHEKAANFGASIVEDVRLPVRMKTLPRIRMLIKMSAIEV